MTADRRDHAVRFALASAVLAAFLAASPGVASFYFLPKLAALAAAAAAAWAAHWVGAWRPRRTHLDAPLAALAAAFAWSLHQSSDPAPGILGAYPLHAYGLVSFALYVALYYAAAGSSLTERPEPLLRTLAAAAALLSAYGLLQRSGVELLAGLPAGLPGGVRITSLQGNPVFLGACLVLAVPAAHQLAGRSGLDRALGTAALALTGCALALTLSRAAWLGAAAALATAKIASGRLDAAGERRGRLIGAAAAVALVLMPAAAWLRPTGASDSGRVEVWRSSLLIAAERPWSGAGPDAMATALARHATDRFIATHGRNHTQGDAHNDLLQAVATLGAGGLLAYLWLLWALLRQTRAALLEPGRREPAAAIAGGLAGLFVLAKLNALPLSALAVASVLAGLLAPASGAPDPGAGTPDPGAGAPAAASPKSPPRPAPSGRARLGAAAAAVACAAIALLATSLLRADASQARAARLEASGRMDGALREYANAVRLNPWEPFYARAWAQALFTLAKRSEDPSARRRLMEEAAGLGERAASMRPAAATGSHIRGTALGMLRVYGGPDRLQEAAASLDRALELDWSAPGTLENRLIVARLQNDAAAVRSAQARLDKLRQLATD